MTQKEKMLRQLAVDVMQSWLGYSESNGKHKIIIDMYNSQSPLPVGYAVKYQDHWCATTVSAVGVKLNLTDTILPECSCVRMIELYKAKGRWKELDSYVPDMGDIIMYDWEDSGVGDNTGTADHVGMILNVDTKTKKMQVIEGNYKDQVKIREMEIDGRYIRGYCLPDYATASKTYNFSKKTSTSTSTKTTTTTTTSNTSTTTTKTTTKTSTSSSSSSVSQIEMILGLVPNCKKGDKNNSVAILQTILTYLGFKCEVDGDFGPETETQLKKYQAKVGIKSTGSCNKDVWLYLLQGKK